jgi:hypothetical protein
MCESNEMKWVRQVRNQISSEVKGMNPKQRVEYLKKQSKNAKEIMNLTNSHRDNLNDTSADVK